MQNKIKDKSGGYKVTARLLLFKTFKINYPSTTEIFKIPEFLALSISLTTAP